MKGRRSGPTSGLVRTRPSPQRGRRARCLQRTDNAGLCVSIVVLGHRTVTRKHCSQPACVAKDFSATAASVPLRGGVDQDPVFALLATGLPPLNPRHPPSASASLNDWLWLYGIASTIDRHVVTHCYLHRTVARWNHRGTRSETPKWQEFLSFSGSREIDWGHLFHRGMNSSRLARLLNSVPSALLVDRPVATRGAQ